MINIKKHINKSGYVLLENTEFSDWSLIQWKANAKRGQDVLAYFAVAVLADLS